MLKHENIIKQLSVSQKLRLLCDIGALSEKEYRVIGIPRVKISYADEVCTDKYPSPYMLANSWNVSLAGEVAGEMAKVMASGDTNIVITPAAKVKLTPYGKALSEDACLSSEMSAAYIGAIEEKGMSSCVRGFSLTADEADSMDEKPHSRSIFEYVVKPYKLTAEKKNFKAVTVLPDLHRENYRNVNSRLCAIASSGEVASGTFLICEKAGMTETVPCISGGAICLEGAPLALESALNRYNQILKAMKNGTAAENELEEELEKGSAISPETVDEAVNRVIEFAFACKREKVLVNLSGADADELAVRAAKESAVLLKNQSKLLPLSKKHKVCVIGDIAMNEPYRGFAEKFSSALSEKGYNITGSERGYDLAADISEELTKTALAAANEADTVIVFLGMDKNRESRLRKSHKLSIPANQQFLLDKLGELGKKTVAVLSGDCMPDIALEDKAEAILLAAINTEASAKALADILSGDSSPCGKLSSTMYLGTDTLFREQLVYKKRDGMKTGPFVGYRYYDAAEYKCGYPFGHGLTYSEFLYSGVTVKNGAVSFTVKNVGKMRASETVQVYIGMKDSAVIRPKKELCAFAKAELAPGEKQTFSFPIKLPGIFDTESRSFIFEKGTYTVYVGSSSADIKHTCDVHMGDTEINSDGEKISDYLPSETNVITDNYKLEANCKIMRKSVLNIIAGAVSIILAVLLKAYCSVSDTNAAFFDIVSAALAVFGWIFFITEIAARSKERKRDRQLIDEANAKAFEDAENIPLASADSLFASEFDTVAEDEVAVSVADDYSDGIGAENLIYIDTEHTFGKAVKDFMSASAEKGFSFAENDACKLFASLSSSRIAVMNSMDTASFRNLMLALGNYFESPILIDTADETYTSAESLLFKTDAAGNRTKTNMFLAMNAAQNAAEKIHFVGIDGIKLELLPNYFAPVLQHAKNPYVHHPITAHNEQNTESVYYLPKNLWFIINLAEGESIGNIPANLADIATVNNISVKECAPSEEHVHVHSFSYYQMEYLSEKMMASLAINEDTWKKVDKIEHFTNARAPYHISNKLWLCLEKYVAVMSVCGAEENRAIDEAVAAKLLPSVITLLDGKLGRNDTTLTEALENAFGEDNIAACRKLIKTGGANVI